MPVYVYKAATKSGQVVTNKVEDLSKFSLIEKLKRNGLTPISVVQKKELNDLITGVKQKTGKNIDVKFNGYEKVNMRDVMVFTQNLYLLKKANFNNIHALETILESTQHKTLKLIIEDILAGLKKGESMYATMEHYSNVFPYIYTNMIRIGELSDSLTVSLEQAVKYLDETSKINKRIKEILVPNIAQFVLLLVMLIGGTLFAIPAIQGVFDSIGSQEKLPAITLWFAGVLDSLVEYWYIPVLIIAGIALAIISYVKTPRGRYNFDYFKYKMPVFGKLIFALDFSRLIRATVLNLQNGMRIQEALEVSKKVSKNTVMLSMVERAINNTIIGESWIEPFEKSGLAEPMIIEMLKIGMQTNLVEMMEKLLEYMQIDIENIMERVMKALPQIVYAIVGVFLIFFVLVVLVPCVQLYMGTFIFSAYGF